MISSLHKSDCVSNLASSHDELFFKTIYTLQIADLSFKVGAKEVNNLRMIERHYFRNKLIKSYDFKFGFCIPESVNGWDASYKVPALEPELG